MPKLDREYFEALRDELMGNGPLAAEFDIDDPNVRFALLARHAIMNGDDFTWSTSDGVRHEGVHIVNYGLDDDGIPMLDVKIINPDGRLSEAAAQMVSFFIGDGHKVEISRLTEPEV